MINLRLQAPEVKPNVLAPRIAVIGVGGAGGNAVNNMIAAGLDGVEFMVCNTDAQALAGSRAPKKIQLGSAVTGGLGAGAKPEVGRAAAQESLDDVMAHIEGANMVFITSGMGGGTGTGVSPVLAQACKSAGILTVGVVTKPFHFEGPVRMKAAEEGIRDMQQYVDTLIVIPNQNLFRIATEKTTFADSFKLADNVLLSAVRGVTDLMITPGLVNLDFNDIKTTMTEMGKAMMGTGEASGDRRAILAAEAAINNPLLDDVSMKGAKGVIINLAGGNDMTLFEIDEACNRIREEVDADANIIFGTSVDEGLQGSLRVTVLATGVETEADRKNREEHSRVKRAASAHGTWTPPGGGKANDAPQVAARTYTSAPAPTPVYETAIQAPAPLAETATYVQGQAFIPPAPMDADMGVAPATTVSYNRMMSGVPAPKAVMDMQESDFSQQMMDAQEPIVSMAPLMTTPVSSVPVQPVISQSLEIPAAMTAAHMVPAARRDALVAASTQTEPALSLFQRITQRVRRTVEVAFEDAPAAAPRRAPHVQYVAVGTAAAAAPAQMEQPAGTPAQPELDLDIPAFLRRQAS
jgi:cell division protein FtsZ